MPDQSYRKVDIDALDEDQYVEEEEQIASGSAAVDVKAIQSEVRALIQKGNYAGAVSASLATPPRSKASDAIKADYLAMVMEALTSVKTAADISTITKSFSVDQIDTLMKYIYKGMSKPESFNAATLLTWHEKAFEMGGVGSIVRVMVDRNLA